MSRHDTPELIAANVRLAVEKLAGVADVPFGLDRASVAWVAGFIDRQRARDGFDPDRTTGLVDVLGSGRPPSSLRLEAAG